MGFVSLFLPEKSSHRVGHRDPFWNGRKKPFMIAAIASAMLLQILFLVNMSYLFGSLFKSEHRVHNLHILTVDYDGGVIGKSLQGAITQLKADTFPTFDTENTNKYPAVEDIVRSVRKGEHWAAVFSHAGASERLAAALEGGDAAAAYDPTNTLTYVWNEVRYPAMEDGTIKSSMSQLMAVARIAYNHINGTGALQTLNKNDPAALQVFLNPIQAGEINIMPTTQGTRVLYNTVGLVMPIIMQFFFLMAINGVSAEFKLYSHLPVLNNGIIRLVLSLSYTFVGSLCWAGYIWAFRETWSVGAGQFFCTWVIIWLFMHINFIVVRLLIPSSITLLLPQLTLLQPTDRRSNRLHPHEVPAVLRIDLGNPQRDFHNLALRTRTCLLSMGICSSRPRSLASADPDLVGRCSG